MNTPQPTNQELLQAIQAIQTNTQAAQSWMQTSLTGLRTSINDLAVSVNVFATNTEQRLTNIKKILPTLATKEDIAILAGRMNRKTEALVEGLVSEKSLSRSSADRILAMPPSLEAC